MTGRLDRLLRPRSIAFVGGRSLTTAIENATALGFDGRIDVVNPNLGEVAGHPTVRSIADLAEPPDAAFVAVRRDRAVDAVRELARIGTGGCVCMTAGFAEVGGDGPAHQRALVEAAGPDLPLIGPNCYGILNYLDGVALWPDLHGGRRVDRGVAIIAQSGNISLNATIADRSLPIGLVVSTGNQAVLGAADLLDAVIDDDRIVAVGCYVESVPDPTALGDAIARARRRGVPVVAIAAGASEAGARLAATHTGATGTVAGPGLLRDLGAVVVRNLPALLEALKLLATWRGGGRSLVALGASGGDLSLFVAEAEAAGLRFPPFDAATARELGATLGPLATVGNPLDTNTGVWGDRDALERVFETVTRLDVDGTVLLLDVPPPAVGDLAAWDAALDAFAAVHTRTGRPVAVVSTLPEGLPPAVRTRLAAAGVVPLQGVHEAASALDAAARWYADDGSSERER